MILSESEVYVDERGYAHDDEGNTWRVSGMQPGVYKASQFPYQDRNSPMPKRQRRLNLSPNYSERQKEQLAAIDAVLKKMPNNNFMGSIRRQVEQGVFLSEKQKKAAIGILKKFRLGDKVKAFESEETTMRELIDRLEEGSKGDVDARLKEVVKPYAKKIGEVEDKLKFSRQVLERLQEDLDEAEVPFSHPVWKATSVMIEKFLDAADAVRAAKKFGF
jgi:hypothetical protein